MDDPKNNRARLLYYIKLCPSFQRHQWIKKCVTVRKRSIRVKIGDFSSLMTLKLNGWYWKTIGHLLYTMSSFVHHFKATGEFKLELQSGNAQFGSQSAIFFPLWPWNLMDDIEKQQGTSYTICQALCISSKPLVIPNWSDSPKHPIWTKIDDLLAVWPWNLTIDLENNRAPLLNNIKHCASFHQHMWIQTGVTVRKRLSWVLTSVTLTFESDLDLLHGHRFCHW